MFKNEDELVKHLHERLKEGWTKISCGIAGKKE